jgi:hypothetical protein
MKLTACVVCGDAFYAMSNHGKICSRECKRLRTNENHKRQYLKPCYRGKALKRAANYRASGRKKSQKTIEKDRNRALIRARLNEACYRLLLIREGSKEKLIQHLRENGVI